MNTRMITQKSAVILFILIVPFIIFSACQKDSQNKEDDLLIQKTEPYILSLLDSVDQCDTDYFISLVFDDRELYYEFSESTISMVQSSSSGFGDMIGKGYSFRNNTTDESIEIMFYVPEVTPVFTFQTAAYRFGNPWNSVSGANVEFFSPTDEPSTYLRYLGTTGEGFYFQITCLNDNIISGQFRTELVECCGGSITYNVEGEFSIPRVYF